MTVKVEIDSRLFDDDMIVRAMHRYSADFFVDFSRSEVGAEVRLTPMREGIQTVNLAERFTNDLLDERLRAIIRKETSRLHLILVQAAMRQATPVADSLK